MNNSKRTRILVQVNWWIVTDESSDMIFFIIITLYDLYKTIIKALAVGEKTKELVT